MFKLVGVIAAITLFGGYFTMVHDNSPAAEPPPPAASIYDFTMKDIDGKEQKLDAYKGDVMMIVNTASKCGNTPQYRGLESIYEKYKDKGFVILGFPANDFHGQEPGTDKEIKEFCTLKY